MVSFKWDPDVAMQVREEEAQERGIKIGEKIGEKRGAVQATLASIRSLMKKLHMTAEEAMSLLEIPASEQKKYVSQL